MLSGPEDTGPDPRGISHARSGPAQNGPRSPGVRWAGQARLGNGSPLWSSRGSNPGPGEVRMRPYSPVDSNPAPRPSGRVTNREALHGRQGSNLRPPVLETGALPAELLPYQPGGGSGTPTPHQVPWPNAGPPPSRSGDGTRTRERRLMGPVCIPSHHSAPRGRTGGLRIPSRAPLPPAVTSPVIQGTLATSRFALPVGFPALTPEGCGALPTSLRLPAAFAGRQHLARQGGRAVRVAVRDHELERVNILPLPGRR